MTEKLVKPTDIPITIPGAATITGTDPIVVIGPNGVGKSRLMRRAAKPAQFVSAQRRTHLSDRLQSHTAKQAASELNSHYSTAHSTPWEFSSEIDNLFSKILAEHYSALYANNEAAQKGKDAKPFISDTTISKLERFWETVFANRKLSFSDFSPLAYPTADEQSKAYPARSMSDGERACLYLAARVLTAEPGLLVIDEPELHLHKKLAVDYWNALEEMRPDLRFVYITHDLHFALSRRKPIVVVVQSETKFEIANADAVKDELAELLLGAATLTINAKRVIFFEGISGQGLAHELFKRWITGADTAAVGVGGRTAVINAGTSFASLEIIANADVISLIDRDHGPEAMLNAMQKPALVLKLHEIESLFALPQIMRAVAQHMHYAGGDPWPEFLKKARESLEQGMAKAVELRVKATIDNLFQSLLANVTGGQTVQQVATVTLGAVNQLDLANKIPRMCADEEAFIRAAMGKSDESILVVMSGKSALKVAASVLGMKDDAYSQLVLGALEDPKDPLSAAVVGAMAPYLPSRV